MTPEAAGIIEDYVRAGGVLVCGDAEAFGFDLAGNDTHATRERILGIKTLGPKRGNLAEAVWRHHPQIRPMGLAG